MSVHEPGAAFWAVPAADVVRAVGSGEGGLSDEEAARRQRQYAGRALHGAGRVDALRLLASQFLDPMVLLLGAAAIVAASVGSHEDAVILLIIILISGLLGFYQEFSAARAVERLLALVAIQAEVRRGGRTLRVPVSEVVPGDLVRLATGSTVPGDVRILEADALHCDESSLTGEPWPVEKSPGVVAEDAPAGLRASAAFLGSHVVSGSGVGVVVAIGRDTRFGQIGADLAQRRGPTDFERGIQRFGYLLLRVTMVLVLAVFAVHVASDRPVLEAFLFAVALAVGLVPELLPAIVTVTLARGARRMVERRVIVKRLAAIEDFGSMDVLCSDKTGTLTEGHIRVHAALGVDGGVSSRVLELAALNATLQASFDNPIDRAVQDACPGVTGRRVAELPYDFHRKRLSVLVETDEGRVLITKGALTAVLAACSDVERDGGAVPIGEARAEIDALADRLAADGYRTLGVAWRRMPEAGGLTPEDEAGLQFAGILALTDPPKPGADATVKRLHERGVRLKIVTGDDHRVAAHVAREVGVSTKHVLRGSEVRSLTDAALARRVGATDIFAEVEPEQKERILRALRRAGHVVGYLGDGINDAAALHAADVGISVDSAADVAKEAADIVLLAPDLDVLVDGVEEGRRTFANTLKYIQITTSANFGNMISMAGASLLLPFLPLLPKQILLNNLLSDLPAMTIAADTVDPELVARPRKWDMAFIGRFMVVFGAVSAVFDFATFGALLYLPGSSETTFQTGWFIESVMTELLILLVIRTRRAAWRSRPAAPLLWSTAVVAVVSVALPWTPLAGVLGLVPLPGLTLATLGAITVTYTLVSEGAKRWMFARYFGEKGGRRARG